MLLSADDSEQISGGSPYGNRTETYRLAVAALADMQRRRICPTPQAYELWLTYHANLNPALTSRINEMLRTGETVTPAAIQALRTEFALGGSPADDHPCFEHDPEMSDSLQDAATALLQHAAEGRSAIRDFGEVLAQGFTQLGEGESGLDVMRVITMLTSETLKMAEHNRDLREKLASTSGKVEKLRRMLATEKQAASTDQLTGLANRRAFDVRVKRLLAKSATDHDGQASSLLLLDLDHFKRLNDSYGHSTGDLVLRLVGRLLIESVKGRDIAARYGGEEFAILLVGAELDAAAKVARQICASLASKRFKLTNLTEQGQGRVTISIGVTQLRATDSLVSAMERADTALYAAKRAGRNQVVSDRETTGS